VRAPGGLDQNSTLDVLVDILRRGSLRQGLINR
jgi:hypothetical protein